MPSYTPFSRLILVCLALMAALFLAVPSAWALDVYLQGYSDFEYLYDAERFRGGERDYRSFFLQRHHLDLKTPLVDEKWAVLLLGGDFEQSLDGTNKREDGKWQHDYRNTWRSAVNVRLELLPLSPVNFYFGFRQSWAASKTNLEKDEEPRTQWEGGVRLKLPYNINIMAEHQEVLGQLRLLGMGGQDPDSIHYLRNSLSRVELTHHSAIDDIFLSYTYHRIRDYERDYDQNTRSDHPGEQHLGILRAKLTLSPTVVFSATGEYSQAESVNRIKNYDTDRTQTQDGETRLADTLMQLDWTPWRTTQLSFAYGFSYTRTELDNKVDNLQRHRGGIQITSVLTDKLGLLSDLSFNHNRLNKGFVVEDEEASDQRTDTLRYRLRLIFLHIPYIRIVPQYTLVANWGQRVEESTTHNISLGIESVSWRGMQAYTIAEFEHRRINYRRPFDDLNKSGDSQKLFGGQVGVRGTPLARLNFDANFRYTDSDEFNDVEGKNRTATVKVTLDYEPIEGKLHIGTGWQYLWRRQHNGEIFGTSAHLGALDRRDGIASLVVDYRPRRDVTLSLDYVYRFYRINQKTTAWIREHWEVSPRVAWNFYRQMFLTLQFRYSDINRQLDRDSVRYYGMVKLTIPFALIVGDKGVRWDK